MNLERPTAWAVRVICAGFAGQPGWLGSITKTMLVNGVTGRLDMNWSFEVGLSRAGDTRYNDPSYSAPLSPRQGKP